MLDPHSQPSDLRGDPYRGVILVLLAAAIVGTAVALVGGWALEDPVVLDAAVALGLSTGVLVGVALTQSARSRPPTTGEAASTQTPTDESPAPIDDAPVSPREIPAPAGETSETGILIRPSALLARARAALKPRVALKLRPAREAAWLRPWFQDHGPVDNVRTTTALGGGLAILFLALSSTSPTSFLSPTTAGIWAAVLLGAAGLSATAVHYLSHVDTTRLPEGPGLCRGARVISWIFILSAVSIGLIWAGQLRLLWGFHLVVLAITAAACYGLLTIKPSRHDGQEAFPLDLEVLSVFGSRPNALASLLDAGEQQLGIDLRSTWALTVVRQSLEPLAMGLCFLGWLSTSLTVVGPSEQGLVERLGVPVNGPPLQPGLHLHWPWPVDTVFRIPVLRVQVAQVGHEGQEEEGPENVLWAVEHAPNEFTLVLGNGRDLITIDAAVQYRIADAPAWRYHCQNPQDALKAIAYRAVMRNTVNRTLSDALSENVNATAGRMRAMVQQDADALGLGVEVLGFTVGGMHPPVAVAGDYQAVISAELGKVTAVVNAQAYRNGTIPQAEAGVLERANSAQGDGALTLAQAAGEAWSFRTLEAQYRAAPQDYFFRRRLETLERGLAGRGFTVIDARIQRDGGELWLTK